MYWLMVLESGKAKMKEPASGECLTVPSCTGKIKRGRDVYTCTQTQKYRNTNTQAHVTSRLNYDAHNQPKLVAASRPLYPRSLMPHPPAPNNALLGIQFPDVPFGDSLKAQVP